MPERIFAIGIDDHDWSREVHSLSFRPSATFRTVRDGRSVRRLPGRRTASMALTLRRTEDTEALVGTVPEDGRAEVLLMRASVAADVSAVVVARRFDATTLLPPWDTTIEIDDVAYFESPWRRVAGPRLPLVRRVFTGGAAPVAAV